MLLPVKGGTARVSGWSRLVVNEGTQNPAPHHSLTQAVPPFAGKKLSNLFLPKHRLGPRHAAI